MSNHGRTGFVKWICCWTQVSVVLKGRLDPKVPLWGSEVDMTTENKLHSEFIIKLFSLIYSDHIWSSDSCLLKRLHTFFPSMCRPAPRRLKWFTAGHITTVIRDRRIYNFLSLNTSLRIVFFYDCAVRTVFHGFGLFTAFSAGRVVFVCRPCDEAVTAISTGPVWRCSVLMCWVQERIRTVVLQCLAQGHWGEPKSVTGRKME